SLFSVMTGVALVFGYALLGAGWLNIKATGELQAWSRTVAERVLYVVLLFVVAVSLATPYLDPVIAARWFSFPNILYLSPVPIATAAAAAGLWWSLRQGREILPFLLGVSLFLLCFLGLGVSLFPYIVPREITIWEAAAQRESQIFLLVGVVVLIPVILAYTAYAYAVFRGKVRGDEGYH
ncbi:MAG: cytochrome d ubiquinol oxidase subunit II, partial [Geminicoccales bacterium]